MNAVRGASLADAARREIPGRKGALPWRVHLVDETQVVDAAGRDVCVVQGDYETEAELMATRATLIAASHDMFAALKLVRDSFAKGRPDGWEAQINPDSEMAAILAAIRKAEGEQP